MPRFGLHHLYFFLIICLPHTCFKNAIIGYNCDLTFLSYDHLRVSDVAAMSQRIRGLTLSPTISVSPDHIRAFAVLDRSKDDDHFHRLSCNA